MNESSSMTTVSDGAASTAGAKGIHFCEASTSIEAKQIANQNHLFPRSASFMDLKGEFGSKSEKAGSFRRCFTKKVADVEGHEHTLDMLRGTSVKSVNEMMTSASRKQQGVLDPRSSTFIQQWDVSILLLLLVIACITPYEVAFLPSGEVDVLFGFNRLVDLLFLFDMVIAFHVAYPENVAGTTVWVMRRDLIRRHYLFGWFIIDFLSVLPLWIVSLNTEEGEDGAGSGQLLQLVRIIKLLRLLKLTRILKASSIMKRLEASMEITYATLAMSKLLVYLIAWTHLQACIWGLIPQFQNGWTWIKAFNATHYADHGDAAQPLTHWDLYVASFYHSSMTVTGIGYGDMLPVSTAERTLSSILMLWSGMLWCYVMGSTCAIAATFDPRAVSFRTTMDALNMFMRDRGLPRASRIWIRSYFHKIRHLQTSVVDEEQNLLSMMSPIMQSSVSLASHEKWLAKIWFLAPDPDCDINEMHDHRAFIAKVSQRLTSHCYVATEQLRHGPLYIVKRGLAIRRMKFLSSGDVWGEDMILENPDLVDYSNVAAVTFVEVFALSRESLQMALNESPISAERLRKRSRRMLVQRLVIRKLREETQTEVSSFVTRDKVKTELPVQDLSLEGKVDLLLHSNDKARRKYNLALGKSVVEEEDVDEAGTSFTKSRQSAKRSTRTSARPSEMAAGAAAPAPSAASAQQRQAALQKLQRANEAMVVAQQAMAEEIRRLMEDAITPGSVWGGGNPLAA